MSELLDKQVNAQKEKTSGVHESSRNPTKKCDENERNKEEKNDMRIKIIFMEGSPLQRPCEEWVKTICTSLGETIMDTMKVLFEYLFSNRVDWR